MGAMSQRRIRWQRRQEPTAIPHSSEQAGGFVSLREYVGGVGTDIDSWESSVKATYPKNFNAWLQLLVAILALLP